MVSSKALILAACLGVASTLAAPHGVPVKQYEKILQKCGKQYQAGLVNVAADDCVAAEVEAYLSRVVERGFTGRPKGMSVEQYEKIYQRCADQFQQGLINVGVETCAAAEIEAFVSRTLTLTPTIESRGLPKCPKDMPTVQYESITQKCGDQFQQGLINIGVNDCVAAEIEAFLTNLVKRTKGVDAIQYEKIVQKCGKQIQEGLVNVGLDTCVAAEVEAFLTNLVKRTKGVDAIQYEKIVQGCGKQIQQGLINAGLNTCVATEVEAFLTNLVKRTRGVDAIQYEKIAQKCGKQVQQGLINVGVNDCIAAEIEAFVTRLVTRDMDVPEGVTPAEYAAIVQECAQRLPQGSPKELKSCVNEKVAAVRARNGKRSTTRPKKMSVEQYESIRQDCGNQVQKGLINIAVNTCISLGIEAFLRDVL